MKTRSPLTFLFVGLLAVVGTGLVSCKLGGAGVTISVKNASGGEITNLQVKFTGGSKSLPALKPAEFFETKVNPSSASDLVVEFADSFGKQHSAKVDVYFERNYSGTIHVTLEPDGKVTWKDQIKS